MCAHPTERDAEPEGIAHASGAVTREWRETQSDILEFFVRERPHRRVEKQLHGAVGRLPSTNELLDEPAFPCRYRRRDEKSDYLALATRNEHPAVCQVRQCFRL